MAHNDAHIGQVALRVADLDEMVTFYRDVIGLSVLEQDAGTAILGVDDSLLVLEEATDMPPRPPDAAGLFHTAFRVPSRGALGGALERIRSTWQLDGASDHGVSEALYCSDPAGNGIEVYWDRDRSAWPGTDDGGIDIWTKPIDLEPIIESATDTTELPRGTDIGHVHLEVTDLEATQAFYVDDLGLEAVVTVPDATFLARDGYHHHVGANRWNRRTAPAQGRGLAWFELATPSLRPGTSRIDPSGIEVRIPESVSE